MAVEFVRYKIMVDDEIIEQITEVSYISLLMTARNELNVKVLKLTEELLNLQGRNKSIADVWSSLDRERSKQKRNSSDTNENFKNCK